MTGLQTVVELPEFPRRAKAIMSDDERMALVDFIAEQAELIALGKVLLAHYGDRS